MRWNNILSTLVLAAPAWASTRSMWFWNTEKITDQNEVNDLISWATKYDISILYTQLNRDVSTEAYQNFIRAANAQGIKVQALLGDSDWATEEGFPALEPNLEWLRDYQSSADEESRFSAVHFDVEPWVREDWVANQASLTTGLIKVARAISDTAAQDLNNLPVEADIAFWADEIDVPGEGANLAEWMFRNIDATHFMTYRNSPDAMLDQGIAGRSLELAETEGKPVWLSIETFDTKDSIQSYYGSTLEHFLSDLSTIEERASQYSQYAGMGIHYYEGMQALRPCKHKRKRSH